MSHYYFGNSYAYWFRVGSNGGLSIDAVYDLIGVRPVVSLTLGTEFVGGGDGTPTNPYVVKYNN